MLQTLRPNTQKLVVGLLAGLAYFIAARMGTWLVAEPAGIVALWPASGVLLGALLVNRDEHWRSIAICTLIAGAGATLLTTGGASPASAIAATAGWAEGLVAAIIATRICGGQVSLEKTRNVLVLIVSAALASALAAVVGTAGAVIELGSPALDTWVSWWSADAVGMLAIAPMALALREAPRRYPERRMAIEGAILLGGLLLMSVYVFGADPGLGGLRTALPAALALPFLIWAGLRLGRVGTTLANLVLAVTAAAYTIGELGPFATTAATTADRLFGLRTFLAATIGSALVFAAVVAERRRETAGRHSAEDERDTEKRLVQELAGTTFNAVITLDEDGIITDWNPAAERIFGWSRDEVHGRALANLIVPDSLRMPYTAALEVVVRGGEMSGIGERVELTASRRDGREIPVELTLSTIRTDGSLGLYLVVNDLSEVRELQSQRESWSTRAEQALERSRQAEQERDQSQWRAEITEHARVEAVSAARAAERGRRAAEEAQEEAERQAATAERERTEADTAREQAELSAAQAEESRRAAEQAAAEAEERRERAEAVRDDALAAQARAEHNSEEAAAAREQADRMRDEADAARVEAEQARAEAEDARERAESLSAEAETARAAAEQSAENADKRRRQADQRADAHASSRREAEAAQAEAERLAAEAVADRERAEQARGEAESARDEAEQARAEAEQARDEAEQARAEAEEREAEAQRRRREAKQRAIAAEERAASAEHARAEAEQHAVEAEAAVELAERRAAEAERREHEAQELQQQEAARRREALVAREQAELAVSESAALRAEADRAREEAERAAADADERRRVAEQARTQAELARAEESRRAAQLEARAAEIARERETAEQALAAAEERLAEALARRAAAETAQAADAERRLEAVQERDEAQRLVAENIRAREEAESLVADAERRGREALAAREAAEQLASEAELRRQATEQALEDAQMRATTSELRRTETEQARLEGEQRVAEAERLVAEAERRVAEADSRVSEADGRIAEADRLRAEAERMADEAEQRAAAAGEGLRDAEQARVEAERRAAAAAEGLHQAERERMETERRLVVLQHERGDGDRLVAEANQRHEAAQAELRSDLARVEGARRNLERSFEDAPLAMALADVKGRLVKVNPAFCELTGRERERLETTTIQELAHGADHELIGAGVRPLLECREGRWRAEVRLADHHGRDLRVDLGVTLVSDDTGAAPQLLVHAAEVSTRREQEERSQDDGDRDWAEHIRAALADDCFVLHAQPIVGLRDDDGNRNELLIRLVADNGELIPPATFLYVAERFGLAQELDQFALAAAVEALRRMPAGGVRFEVNLSAASVADPGLPDLIAALLREAGVSGGGLCLAVDEAVAIDNIDRARQLVHAAHALGCEVVLDHFGSGLASFHYLQQLAVDYVKIDGSFIKDLPHNRSGQMVVKSVVEVARSLGCRTIAERVGDAETLRLIESHGIDFGQGFYLGEPRPLEDLLHDGLRRSHISIDPNAR